MAMYCFFPTLAIYSRELVSSCLTVCFVQNEQYFRLKTLFTVFYEILL